MLEPLAGEKTLIAELGINHDGSPEVAAQLIKSLSDCGVETIKLQYRNIDRAYLTVPNSLKELGDEIVGSELERTHLNAEQQGELLKLGHRLGQRVGISFFHVEDVADFGSMIAEFDFFKVPSAELENADLIDRLLDLDRPVLISTGGHTEEQISTAFERIMLRDNWLPLHAVMNYPTEHHNAQLGYIKHLSDKWGRPVGYSSHDADWEVCLFAAALGAAFVERHVTHSRTASGLDHGSSSDLTDVHRLSRLLQALPVLQRCPNERMPNQGELINLQNLGRSYYARESLENGTRASAKDFDYRAPRRGFGSRDAQRVWGQPLVQPILAGEALGASNFRASSEVSDTLVAWANQHSVGIPIRPGDWRQISENVPVRTREFHLSYQDVQVGLAAAEFPDDCLYSVHLPDYVSPTDLLNPYSNDDEIREASRLVLQRCMRFAQELQDRSQSVVPVVGSFSVGRDDSTESFYEGQRELVDEWDRWSVPLVHQWLPPFAWYFGGSVPVRRFNSLEDLELCFAYGIPLCIDTAHAALCVNAGHVRVEDFYEWAETLVVHSHIAGASGIDAEGIPLAHADETCWALVDWVIKLPTAKILEKWQGHLSRGQGFVDDLVVLYEAASPLTKPS